MKKIIPITTSFILLIFTNYLFAQSQLKSTLVWGDQTYWKANASSGNWNANNWYDATQNWDDHNPNYEGGRNLIFDNNDHTSMTNDFSGDGAKRWQITFAATATSSRTIDGTTENTFYDNSSIKPKIENLSDVNHTINFPIKIGYNPLELNPINGNLTINSAINNNGNYIDVYGLKNKILTLSGELTGSGGISLKQNSKIIFSTVDKSFTGVTVLEAGTLDLRVNLSSSITVKSSSTLLINGSVTIPNLTIEDGGIVTVNAGQSLTVTGTLTNSAGATGLVVKSGGSLIQNSAVSATVERDIPAWTAVPHGWHLLSSPVTSQAISTAFTDATPENYDFYAWWEPTNVWVNFKNTGTTPTWNDANSGSQNFVPGIGYLVSYSSASTKQFTGTLNNSDVTVNNMAISSGTNKGWHLVGNPFSSAVTWSLCTRTNINATAKIWSESDAAYVDVTNGDIPALNGFMVQVTSGTGSLTIPTTARVHNNTTSWYKSGEASEILLVANDPEGQTAQESKIHLDAASTVNFDSEFDSHFLPGYAPQFYSKVGDEMLSTNTLPSLPAETVIPFGFVKNDAASFSIELKQSIAGYSVFLKDLKTNTDQNLSDNPVYTFTSEAGDDPNRFLLHFLDVTSVPDAAKESFSVYISNGNLNVATGRATNAEIRVSNMAGQVVLQGKTNGNTLTNLSTATLRNGVYVVTLLGSSMVESRKIVLNR